MANGMLYIAMPFGHYLRLGLPLLILQQVVIAEERQPNDDLLALQAERSQNAAVSQQE